MKTRSLWLLLILTTCLLTGCTGAENEAEVKAGPGSEQFDGEMLKLTTGNGIDTQYISKDFAIAGVVRPGKILDSPLVKMLGDNGVPVRDHLQEFTTHSGVDPKKIEQVILLVDQKSIMELPGSFMGSDSSHGKSDTAVSPPIRENTADKSRKDPPEKIDNLKPCGGINLDNEDRTDLQRDSRPPKTPPGIGIVVRFSAAPDEAAVAENLRLKKRSENGKTFYDSPDGIASAHFVDSKTLLFASNGLLPKMMVAKDVSSPLTKLLGTANPDNDLMVAIPMASLKDLIEMGLQDAPPPVAQNGDLIRSVDALVIAANLGGDSLLNIRMDMSDADSAKKLTTQIQDGLGKAKEELAKSKENPQGIPIPMLGELISTIEELVNGITVKQADTRVVINIKSISLDKLKTQLKPVIEKVKEAEKITGRMNDLKQIAIAFHNHHDVYKSMPTAGSANEKKGKGLSWRVHLLPFLDESELYGEFNLDEAWDSENNKKLIAKMPKIFEIPNRKNDGKTTIHVFTGKGTPFNGPKPIRFRDVTDGTSNTIMCVESGEDKAEVWTKPGGLKIDPKKNPWDAIGKIESRGVLVAMMDGSVKTIIKSVSADTVRFLIQYADGKFIDYNSF